MMVDARSIENCQAGRCLGGNAAWHRKASLMGMMLMDFCVEITFAIQIQQGAILICPFFA
jgi:hypothetical protein